MSIGWSTLTGEPAVIVGREDELRYLRDSVDQLRIQGQPLLLLASASPHSTWCCSRCSGSSRTWPSGIATR